MPSKRFRDCLHFVLEREGGFVDHPSDPGGATNRGITCATLASWRGRPVTVEDVRTLGLAETAEIYHARFWDAVLGDALPPGFDLVAFDAAVHHGPKGGACFLQHALGVKPDGVIGPKTIAAAAAAVDGPAVITRACRLRIAYLKRRKHAKPFIKGWTARIAKVEARATTMFAGQAASDVLAARIRELGVRTRAAATQDMVAAAGTGAVTLGALTVDAAAALAVALVFVAAVILAIRNNRRRKASAETRRQALLSEWRAAIDNRKWQVDIMPVATSDAST